MKQDGITFHHPVAFWVGNLLVLAGVLSHAPMLWMGRHTHWQMVGMPMRWEMWLGMALIPLGLVLATLGLMPRITQMRRTAHPADGQRFFHVADNAPLNRRHWTLVAVLLVALAVDVMKPATLGFVLPGMSGEYGISMQRAGLLPLVALTGTTVGSLLWGRISDLFGRRAAILLSALMFIGASICGAMPSFGWNLVMCFLMGASAGGLLPIAFTLMAETIPAAHRGWLLVLLGGVGTSAGYLLASGAAATLEPIFSWRVLWLLGLPTGALIVLLNRWIPESPRFLANAGLQTQARAVLQRFASGALQPDDAAHPGPPMIDETHPVSGMYALLRGRYARISWGLLVCGVAWGLVNFGVLLWLPVNLVDAGIDARASSALLAKSALLALPGIVPVIALYHCWSTVRALVLFIALTALSLLGLALAVRLDPGSQAAIIAATSALLVSISGVIAMLIPYAAEVYPVRLRGTGAGMIAAGTKFGGIVGAGLGVAGFFQQFVLSALLIAVPMAASAVLLLRHGVETRGRRLEEIERSLAGDAPT